MRIERREPFLMPLLIVSTGIRLLSEQVRRAEYYPRGSLRSRASIHDESAHPEQDFLYVGTVNSATYVCGSAAAQDVTALEDVGVRVYHHDRATVSHGQTSITAVPMSRENFSVRLALTSRAPEAFIDRPLTCWQSSQWETGKDQTW